MGPDTLLRPLFVTANSRNPAATSSTAAPASAAIRVFGREKSGRDVVVSRKKFLQEEATTARAEALKALGKIKPVAHEVESQTQALLKQRWPAPHAAEVDELDKQLQGLLAGRRRVFYTFGEHPEWDPKIAATVREIREVSRRGAAAPTDFVALETTLHEQRLIKTEAELGLIRHACRVTAGAHVRAMRATQPGGWEWAVAAEIHHEFERHDMQCGYGSIVGGGDNACILHYKENEAQLRDGDVITLSKAKPNPATVPPAIGRIAFVVRAKHEPPGAPVAAPDGAPVPAPEAAPAAAPAEPEYLIPGLPPGAPPSPPGPSGCDTPPWPSRPR